MSSKPPPLYHLVSLWISLTRDLHQHADRADQDRFGARIGDLLIRAAIYKGTIEGSPLTAAKLATYVGIPRATVVRRLSALERRRLIERHGRAWRTPAALVEQRQRQDFSAIVQLVHRAADKLQRRRQ